MQLENLVITENSKLRNALELLEKSGKKLIIVIDKDSTVTGVITDGDIRRGLLKGISLDIEIQDIMTKNFLYIKEGESYSEVQKKAFDLDINGIPLLDSRKKLIKIIWLNKRPRTNEYENQIILMAGGKGKRLYPLTKDIPKPMIEINGLPIIHHIINRINKQGFYKFNICVNYKKDIIKNYFGDGSKFNIEIKYTEEKNPLGTAGSLSLIPSLSEPAILLNADVLTNIDFQDILMQNNQTKSSLTIVTKNDKIFIPYGVVETDLRSVIDIKEKPTYDFLVNTGIYLISEQARKLVKQNEYLDMPELVKTCLNNKLVVDHFLCTDNWLDIGRFETLKIAGDYL